MRDSVKCEGQACPHLGHVFVADPNKWVSVMDDGFAVFDIMGWRYCPTTDSGHPIVSTGKYGIRILDLCEGFIHVLRRWPTVKFGTGAAVRREACIHLNRTIGGFKRPIEPIDWEGLVDTLPDASGG